jgi:hypothetical protein
MRTWVAKVPRIIFLPACGVSLAIALLMSTGATAGTVKAASGSLTMTSEAGDYIGAGQQWAYDARADAISVGSERWGTARALVRAANGDFWLLQFTAPGGARLSPGVYVNAQRFADDSHPGLDVEGMGRGCNDTSGSFTVLDVSYGPYGYLQSLHATFEQRCGVSSAALRGDLDVSAPPAPAPIAVAVTVDANATVDRSDGKVRLHGTISCSKPVQVVTVAGDLTQQQKKDVAAGFFNQVFVSDCDTTPKPWEASVTPSSALRFAAGEVAAHIRGIAVDDFYTNYLGIAVATETAIDDTLNLRNG